MYKGYKIRLELNNKQISLCNAHCGVARHAYNNGLAYCNFLYSNGEKIPSAIDLHKWLVANIKKQYPWYYEVSKYTPQQALRNLEISYKNFYNLQKKHNYKKFKYKTINGVKTIIGLEGLPQFKKKGNKDSFYLEGNIITNNNKIKLPKFGWVKCSEILPQNIIIKNVVISRKADFWFISFKIETNINKTIKKYDNVGVDLGIKTLATLSNGETFDNLKAYNTYKKKLLKYQKIVSRRYINNAESQSNNYKKAKLQLSKIHYRISNIRKDSINKLTTYLSKNFENVVIEDLNIKGMTKNHKLASAILDGGFFEFRRQLLYKKEWYGGNVIIADRYFPSTKRCSKCNNIKENIKLSDRVYNCDKCGLNIDRDLNASINLRNLAVSLTVSAFGDKSSI